MMRLFLLFMLLVSSTFTFAANNTDQFMAISDIHFDPFLFCQQELPCPLIDKLSAATPEQWDNILKSEAHLIPQYGEDSNYTLLKSSMAEFKLRAQREQPQFVVVLGDFIAHNYIFKFKQFSSDKSQKAYQLFVRKTYEYLVIQLNQAFPTIDVFIAAGNHETYHGSYVVDRDGEYYHDMSYIFSRLIKNKSNKSQLQNQFSLGGYYAVNVKKPHHLKIISLNSLIFSIRASGEEVEKAADEELAWLHNELESAAINGQKVMLIEHIPAGIDVYSSLKNGKFDLISLYKPGYNVRVEAEIKRFSPLIVAVLAGHFHTDWYQLLTYNNNKLAVSGVPSISPLVGNNPGYKLYQYSTKTLELQNFQTYYLPLSTIDQWSLLYDFNSVYQPGCRQCTLKEGMQEIEKTGYIADQFKNYFALQSSMRTLTDWLPYYWCDIFNVNIDAYQLCVANNG